MIRIQYHTVWYGTRFTPGIWVFLHIPPKNPSADRAEWRCTTLAEQNYDFSHIGDCPLVMSVAGWVNVRCQFSVSANDRVIICQAMLERLLEGGPVVNIHHIEQLAQLV